MLFHSLGHSLNDLHATFFYWFFQIIRLIMLISILMYLFLIWPSLILSMYMMLVINTNFTVFHFYYFLISTILFFIIFWMWVSFNIFLMVFFKFIRLIVLISYYFKVFVPKIDIFFILGHAMPFQNINKREEERMKEIIYVIQDERFNCTLISLWLLFRL